MYLAAGLFEHHDRARFEVFAFDNGRDDAAPMRQRVIAAFDKFISIANLSDRDAAARIAAEEVDILVNLNGYFGKMRTGVFARGRRRSRSIIWVSPARWARTIWITSWPMRC